MPPSNKSNKINVKNLVYATITKDSATEFTTGEVKSMGKVMEVSLTPTLASGVLFGDGSKQEDLAKLTGVTAKIDLNKVFIEVRAEIMGNKFENGVLTENASDQPVDIAVGFEVEQTGNHRELIWLLKGKVQPFANTVTQSGENIAFSTDSLTINFLPREFDGAIRMFGDTANEDFTKLIADAFLTKVPGTV